MKIGLGSLAALAAVSIGAATVAKAGGDVDFVVNAMPATILIDVDGKKFATSSPNGRVSLDEVYTMPNIALGAGVLWRDLYVDVVGGGGVIINSGFRSFMLQAIVEGGFRVAQSLDIGPRLGLVYFPDPEWLENDDVEFDSGTGWLLGVQLSMGDKIKYMVSVDLIDSSLDVSGVAPGVETEDDLSLTALAIQFGVRGEF